MITHECSSIKYEYHLLNYYVKFTLPISQPTLPNGPSYYLTILQNPLYRVVKFTLPNRIVNSSQQSSTCCQINMPRYQFHINKAILPNCEVQIHFVNCPNEPPHKKISGLSYALGLLKFLHKKSNCLDPARSPPPPCKTSLSIIIF